jgi:ADP-heptose:LPS heptosyltransferase
MGCGCNDKKKASAPVTFTAEAVEEKPRPTGAIWTVVVGTRGGRGMSPGLIESLSAIKNAMIESHNQEIRVVIVDTTVIDFPDYDVPVGFNIVFMPAKEYSWARAMNLGATYYRSSHFLLFLHDDVTLPEGPGWLRALQEALVDRACIAVPRVTGHCSCPPQAGEDDTPLLSFEITEYISPAVVAIRRDVFVKAGMFPDEMDGYDWAQIALQDTVARMGGSTVVVPSVVVHHAGESSYTADERMQGWERNMIRYAEITGQRAEYKRRPTRVRLPSAVDRKGPALLFVVEANESIERVRKIIDEKMSTAAEVVIVDLAATAERSESFHAVEQGVKLPVRYAPAWDSDPLRQVVNLAASRDAELYDMRVGAPVPAVPIVGPRLRTGWTYALPQLLEEIHLGYLQHAGIGDTVMTTPALHAFRQRWPHIRIVAHHAWAAGEILQFNPDIDELVIYNSGDPNVLPETFDMMAGYGMEGAVRQAYQTLCVEDLTDEPRRVRYFLQREEHDAAVKLLAELGLPPTAKRLVGIQLHGNWQAKNWSSVGDLVRAVAGRIGEGWYPIVFGTDQERMADISGVPHVAITQQPLRIAAAVIGLLDCLVGFDSGLGWLAVALRTPCISLWGPTNPRGYLLDVETTNLVTIRKRVPDQCKEATGVSCRDFTSGARCPLRKGWGADCIDEITVDEVMGHLEAMPTWDRPIEDRWYERLAG